MPCNPLKKSYVSRLGRGPTYKQKKGILNAIERRVNRQVVGLDFFKLHKPEIYVVILTATLA
jgi:hypothetical protein